MHFRFIALAAALASGAASPAFARQPFETETARLPDQGHGDVQVEFEYATSDEGHDIAAPVVIEYGVTDRLKLVVEPDLYASTRSKGAKAVHGFGDTEVRLVYLVAQESASRPAFALGGEVKIPTGKKPELSSGKLDYRLFGIASKRLGRWDLHANLGYTLVGAPANENPPNEVDYSFAAEYQANARITLVAEVLGATPIGGGPVLPGAEADGTLITGLIGARYKLNNKADFSVGATYDSGSAVLFRTALTVRF